MNRIKMTGQVVKNMPWQEKPKNLAGAPVWRYSDNPVINRNPIKGVSRIFNSAVIPYNDEFVGVFRGEKLNGIPHIYLGRSGDGINWVFQENEILFENEDGKPFMPL